MTTEKASVIIGNLPVNGDECYTVTEYQEAKAMAVKALEKQEKYRWHDLRKNPDDLPEDINKQYLCEWVGGSHNWHDVLFFCNDNRYGENRKYFSALDNPKTITGEKKIGQEGQVVAWRYIEPFEEGDTDDSK